ncbi:YqzH family protein [Pseudalkalibacillus hwajinpoensis]|uniref:Uncharacterized protein n=1 Tax=Guptibacillus hwajinpoensis TaxID=208199 RepID=A0A4U1MGH7_9BACL|nr:YqzH family protein [Pseudalkalibacillus hwajinpoensis]TKD70003.1 hypothetical protein FBF83_12115 [Pseudalkalibacillus hwajinpoensis]
MESTAFTRKMVIKTLQDYFGDPSSIPLTQEEINYLVTQTLIRKKEDTPIYMVVHDLVYEHLTT